MDKCLEEIQYISLQVYNNLYYLEYFEKFNDVFEIMGYIFKNKELRKFFVKVNILMFVFYFKIVNSEYIYEIFGFLKLLDIIRDGNGYIFKKNEVI